MKTTKKFLSMLLAALMCVTAAPLGGFVGLDFGITANALSETGSLGENVTYTFNSQTGELNITGTGAMYDYKYTNSSPFYDNKEIKTVNIGEGVTYVGAITFSWCSALKSVTISDSVTEIGNYAFSHCEALESISFGKGLKKVGENFLDRLISLKTITVDKENENFTVVDNVLFNKDKTTLIYYPIGNGSTEYTVPDTVSTIETAAFCGSTTLKEITLSSSVTKVKNLAFKGVPLTDVNFIGTEEQWNEILFYQYNDPIKNATRHYYSIEEGQIGENAFYSLNPISGELKITGTGATYDYKNSPPFWFEENPLYDNKKIKSVTIGEGITSVGDMLFRSSDNIEEVILPSTLKSIGVMAFNECSSLKSVTIPNGVLSIGDYAFASTGVKEITIPDSVTEIYEFTFAYCESLEKLHIGKGIKNYYFYNSALISLKTITVSEENENFTAVDNVVFNKDKTKLIHYAAGKTDKNYTVPEKVTTINDFAFYNAVNIESITVLGSITQLGELTFYNCYNLKEITLPSTLTTVTERVFILCRSLTDVYFAGTEQQWNSVTVGVQNESLTNATVHFVKIGKLGENVFYKLEEATGELKITGTGAMYDYEYGKSPLVKNESIKSVNIGDGVTTVGKLSFYGCKKIESVSLPNTLESIGVMAFNECSALKSITIPDSVTKIESGAFMDCTSVESISVGKGLKTLKEDSFKGTSSLKTITVSAQNESFTAVDNVLFNKNKTTLYLYAPKKTETEYAIPETVNRIVAYSFLKAENIAKVTVPEGVAKIENYTFEYCTALKKAVIPSTVTKFGTGVFYESGLKEIDFGGCAALWNKIEYGSTNNIITEAEYHVADHSFSDVTAKKEPTCLAAGNEAYKKCSICELYYASDAGSLSLDGKANVSDFDITKLEHSYTGEAKSNGNGKYATHSRKCVNGCEKYGGEEAHIWDEGTCTVCNETIAPGVTVSGTVKSFKVGSNATGNEVTTIELIADEKTVYSVTVSGTGKQNYEIDCVEDGAYTVRVSKLNHVTREYEITVDGEEVSKDFEICLLGDVNGNGTINVTDYVAVLQAAKGTSALKGYQFDCANIDGKGGITVLDYIKVLRHAKGLEYLW